MTGQLSIFDVPESLPYQPHSGTSREAADAAAPQAVTHRRMVLELLGLRI